MRRRPLQMPAGTAQPAAPARRGLPRRHRPAPSGPASAATSSRRRRHPPTSSTTGAPPASADPSTSVAPAAIVPGDPSGNSITSSSSPFSRLNDRAATRRPDSGCVTEVTRTSHGSTARNCCSLSISLPAPGKTHLADRPGPHAAEAGYRTYFTTAADLAARCHRAAIEGRWATTMRFFNGPGLLVIDELGYLPLPAEAASALFQVISQRYLKTSIVLTSNRGVGAWGEILGDTTVAAAMLDRLLHRSVVLNLDGDSYRLRDHHARTDTLRRATTGNTRRPLS